MAIMKRLASPRFWPIQRKVKKFVVTPRAGPYAKSDCLPLGVIVRDVLKCAENMKEVKAILNRGLVKVDGRVRRDYRFPVGLMDVVFIGDEGFRMVSSKRGLMLKELQNAEAGIKLLKVTNKRHLRGRKIQINFHDGRNFLVQKDEYKTGDVIVFDLNENKIRNSFRYKRGALVLITGGRNKGTLGEIEEIVNARGLRANKVVVKAGGRKIEIDKRYIFVVGQDRPAISL
ncbi:MAG: 30S ribosomal protein S4e [Candidatus Aenigmarchaeota archaeon]|nr:30S ribosomal protein S4e [Candidatus Aenigmarchaeota archaeon]